MYLYVSTCISTHTHTHTHTADHLHSPQPLPWRDHLQSAADSKLRNQRVLSHASRYYTHTHTLLNAHTQKLNSKSYTLKPKP